ncbi:hypothetical protein KAW48_02850 [candidate division WOR-3 bacterium]|nr:hypothetical protein [candidate division WOR-3 bacterium]
MDRKQELINRWIDKKLSDKEKKELERLCSNNPELKKELRDFKKLKEVMDMLKTKEPDREWEKYWEHLYNRIERGIGWIITSIGAILMLTFIGFQFVKDLINDPQLAFYAKIGILALVFGFVILFVSVIRERFFLSKHDRYSKEVKR